MLLRAADQQDTRSSAFWGDATVLALRLVARGRLFPTVSAGGFDAWRAGPLDSEDSARIRDLAETMPQQVGVAPGTDGEAYPLLRAFLDAVADAMPRGDTAGAAARLAAAGVDVYWPRELAGELTAAAVVGEHSMPGPPGGGTRSVLGVGALLSCRWRLALDGEPLTRADREPLLLLLLRGRGEPELLADLERRNVWHRESTRM